MEAGWLSVASKYLLHCAALSSIFQYNVDFGTCRRSAWLAIGSTEDTALVYVKWKYENSLGRKPRGNPKRQQHPKNKGKNRGEKKIKIIEDQKLPHSADWCVIYEKNIISIYQHIPDSVLSSSLWQ